MSKACIHEVEFLKFKSGTDNKSKKTISHFTVSPNTVRSTKEQDNGEYWFRGARRKP